MAKHRCIIGRAHTPTRKWGGQRLDSGPSVTIDTEQVGSACVESSQNKAPCKYQSGLPKCGTKRHQALHTL
eukprot:3267041-Amphidinium_carterae.1